MPPLRPPTKDTRLRELCVWLVVALASGARCADAGVPSEFGAPFFKFPVGQRAQFVAVADLNNDGWPDIVAANQYSNTI